jgi:hypothetical protein
MEMEMEIKMRGLDLSHSGQIGGLLLGCGRLVSYHIKISAGGLVVLIKSATLNKVPVSDEYTSATKASFYLWSTYG